MSKTDVLNLEWSYMPSRDREAATLVCNYLRLQGLSVVEGNMFNGIQLINSLKPKVLFLTNAIGAKINLEVLQYAMSKGIKCATAISEGNFKEDPKFISQFTWGWNKRQVLYEDIHMHWSTRTRDLAVEHFPQLADRIHVSGGIGFDKYSVSASAAGQSLRSQLATDKYQSVVGIGCWTFGMMYPIDPRHETILKRFSKTEIERFKTDGVAFDEVLCKAAKQCSDVLFLVKLHPGNSMGLSGAGVEALSKLDNVQVVTSEWSVLDCIGAADLWLVYESTTALEAWLLGVPTALVNPSGIDFTRDKVAEGSPNLPTSVDIVDAISSLQGEQPMTAFDDLAPIRDRLIKATIQWADGLNHVRAGNAILDLLEADATPPRSTSWDLRKALWKYKLLTWAKPLLRRSKAWSQYYKHVDGWDQGRLDSYATETMQRQQAYYAQQGLTLTDLKSIQCL